MNVTSFTLRTLLILVVMTGCSGFNNAAIIYTHPAKPPEMFDGNLSRCRAGGAHFTPRSNMLQHMILEFIYKDHFPSVETANCLEAFGWKPALELLFSSERTLQDLEAVYYQCSRDTKYRKVAFSGTSLREILSPTASYLDRNAIVDCLADRGWKVVSGHTEQSEHAEHGLVLPVPLIPAYSQNYLKKGSVLETADQSESWAIECPLLTNTQTWEDANRVIKKLNNIQFGGHADWRLPTTKDLDNLMDMVAMRSANDPQKELKRVGFECVRDVVYWTSTNADNELVWGINLITRQARKLGTSSLYRGAVMPVRSPVW